MAGVEILAASSDGPPAHIRKVGLGVDRRRGRPPHGVHRGIFAF